MTFGFSTTAKLPYGEAVERVKEALKREGFGVITSIDMQETFKSKLGVAFKPYVILGVCNPEFALKALKADESVGLLLPCNVTIIERGTDCLVSAFDPLAMADVIGRPDVEELAGEVKVRLERALRALGPKDGELQPIPA